MTLFIVDPYATLFESDECHLLFDVKFADGRLELLEGDEAVLVGVRLGHDPVDDVLELIVTEKKILTLMPLQKNHLEAIFGIN
jgi:hypothetical protein